MEFRTPHIYPLVGNQSLSVFKIVKSSMGVTSLTILDKTLIGIFQDIVTKLLKQ